MKLTNQQIDALVAQKAAEFAEANKKEDKPVDKKLVALAEKYTKLLAQIPLKILENIGYSRISSVSKKDFLRILTNLEPDKEDVKPIVRFDSNAYRNKILIASIDSKNLAELNSKLN